MLKQGVELWQLLLVGVVLIAAIVWSHQQTHVELSEALDHETPRARSWA